MLKAIQIKDYWIINEESMYSSPELATIIDGNYYNIIAQSKPVHEGIPLFDVPQELEEDVLSPAEYIADIMDRYDIACPLEHPQAKIEIDNYVINYKEKYKWTDEDMICFAI